MGPVYFMIFWIPAVASGTLLLLAGRAGVVERPGKFFVWFLIALLLQLFYRTFAPAWAIGLGLQSILAVYLAIRVKLE